MSKHFTAINRTTGERWKSTNGSYLIMDDYGYLAEVSMMEFDEWDGSTFIGTREELAIRQLDTKIWKCVLCPALQRKLDKQNSSKE